MFKKILGWALFSFALIGIIIAAVLTFKKGGDAFGKADKKRMDKVKQDAADCKKRIDDWLGSHPRAERI